MGFERFGKINLTSESKAAQFVDFLAENKVMSTQCRKCGQQYFPPRMDCCRCLTSDVDWFEIKGKGKVLAFTTANYGPTGFEDEVPYTLAVAQFDSGLKVFGRLSKEVKESEIRIGMEVRPVVVKLPGDKLSYELVPA